MKIFIYLSLISMSLLFVGCGNKDTSGSADTSDSANSSENIYSTAPEGAIVLFDGSDFSEWVNCDSGDVRWKIVDGAMEVVPDSTWQCKRIQGTMTKREFKDFQLHLEFKLPENENTNSGVYIQRRYEVSIYNTYNTEPTPGMGGALYRQKIPDTIVGKPKGEWQTYDIFFRAARFDSTDRDKKIENARITVLHNDVMIHNNVIVKTKTGVGFPEGPEPGPIMLQDHLALVQFRDIWIIPNEPVMTLPPAKH